MAALGALFNSRIEAIVGPGAETNSLLEPALRAKMAPDLLSQLVSALLAGLESVFVALAVLSVAGLLVSLFFPRGSAQSQAHQRPEPAVEL